MQTCLRHFALLLWVALFFAAGQARADQRSITDRLATIEGLRFKELSIFRPGYRVFDLFYTQPADHAHPEGETFEQHLILWHRDTTRPMVLQTSGYSIFGLELSTLASEMGANQIQVEHRFFEASIPASKDFSLLTIQQSAADFHRITVAFKAIYGAKWANTGRSKGGMTSVYHRRFYPNDLDATVAHVAPHSYHADDQRYVKFLADEIGGKQFDGCRAKLLASQKALFGAREQVLEMAGDGNFTLLGSSEVAVEHAIVGMPWSYWQYHGPGTSCSNVPAPDAEISEHLDFLREIGDPAGLADEGIAGFVAYFFQAATQLGAPGDHILPFTDLLHFGSSFTIQQYVPRNLAPVYDDGVAMRDINDWVAAKSEKILYVYGEFDPWTGGAFDARAAGDSYKMTIPAMNHAAQFSDLKGDDRALAYSKLKEWLDLSKDEVLMEPFTGPRRSLEQLEFQALKKRRVLR